MSSINKHEKGWGKIRDSRSFLKCQTYQPIQTSVISFIP
jgi:hypothetical protein